MSLDLASLIRNGVWALLVCITLSGYSALPEALGPRICLFAVAMSVANVIFELNEEG